jgi:Zn-dependent M16 (insulinase) family peptidase
MSSSIPNTGHSFAMMRAARVISARSTLSEQYSGLGQVTLMSEMAGLEDLDDVVDKLIAIGGHVLQAPDASCSLTCGEQALEAADLAMNGTVRAFTMDSTVLGLAVLGCDCFMVRVYR